MTIVKLESLKMYHSCGWDGISNKTQVLSSAFEIITP